MKQSGNITRKYRNQDPDIQYTLVHTVVCILSKKIEVSNSFLSDDTSFRKYMLRYMQQHVTWQFIRAHNEHKDNDMFTARLMDVVGPDFSWDQNPDWVSNEEYALSRLREEKEDEYVSDLIVLDSENVNDITKLYLKDLIVNDIPIDKGLMYSKIMGIVRSLSPVEQELFNLHLIQELTVMKIYRTIKSKVDYDSISYQKLLQMVKDLKSKIKNMLEDDND